MKMLMFEFRETEKEYFMKNNINDIEIEFFDDVLNQSFELSEEQKEDTVILSVFIESNLTEKVLSQFKNLQIVTTRSTGYNHINLEYCRRNNIAVINTPDYGKTSVAQFTIAMMLLLTRNVIQSANDIKNRELHYSSYEGRNLENLTLGVIGTGSIGSAVCEMAHIFGMKLLAHDIKVNEKLKDYVNYVDFNTLIAESDIITLHIPYILEFYHMLSDNAFEKMKDNVYIINTSRGELIDTKSLYKYIKNGKIKGVALDVLECEYLNYESDKILEALDYTTEGCLKNVILSEKLMQFDNVIITPHIAYNTKESVINILKTMFKSIKAYYSGEFQNRVV